MDDLLNLMRRFWNNWELKIMVVVNLVLQVLLLVLGNRRKTSTRMWLRGVVWLGYIAADSVGGVALGMVSSKLGDDEMEGNALRMESRLIAFWAPSLLLLLGGPDTITAYSMEDNELWLRHLLGLVVQTGVSGYICVMGWSSSSYLSYLSVGMMVSAAIKYGERVWVLWQSSKGKRKDLILGEPYAGTNYPTFMEEYSLKQQEGYHVVVDEIVELPVPNILPQINPNIPDALFLVVAHYLRHIVSRLFLDLVMSDDDRDTSLRLLHKIKSSWEDVFKLLEMELSFMYDLLHTKAKVLYKSPWGVVRRFVSLAISSLSLILFCLAHTPSSSHYNRTNLGATFLLLGVILLLDVYSLSAMLTSDWTHVWLAKKGKGPKFGLDRLVPRLNWGTRARWSNSVGQLSLLSFCTKRQSVPYQTLLKRLNIQEKVEGYYHVGHQEVLGTIKRAMLEYVVWRSNREDKSKNDVSYRLNDALKRNLGFDIDQLVWSTEMELDKCILVWHIATELCYHHYGMDRMEEYEVKTESGRLREGHMLYHLVAKILSHYMYYLLVIYPFMLPSGIGQIRVRDTCAEARKFFQERGLWSSSNTLMKLNADACNLLAQVNTEVPPYKVKGERSKSVLFDGCRLASALLEKFSQRSKDLKRKDESESKIAWRTIADVWIEILAIAARQCTGDSHALQLRRGGELLTFQWLLMAHYGLTDHFQMTKGHAIARLILH